MAPGPPANGPTRCRHSTGRPGYVFGWGPQRDGRAGSTASARVVESIDKGWPILGFGAQMDLAVLYGYEADGGRVLLSDYWASDDPSVMPIGDAKEIGMFIEQIQEPSPRRGRVRAGLSLAAQALARGHSSIPIPTRARRTTTAPPATSAGLADLGRFDELDDGQRANLFFLNSWTYSALHQNRSGHAARYLRSADLGKAPPARSKRLPRATTAWRSARTVGSRPIRASASSSSSRSRPGRTRCAPTSVRRSPTCSRSTQKRSATSRTPSRRR